MSEFLDSPSNIAAFRTALLAWYGANKRSLAWRDSDDPYHVWISEIMLQQTRVDQMDNYFTRFIERFPALEDLAAAQEADVLKVWEGLGYYARARNMHKAAQLIVAEHGGRVPNTYEELIALPGIGEYTAAAVSSIAFDRDHAVLDGNVVRVLCRLLRIEEDPRRTATKAQLISASQCLLQPGRAGDFNQGMMELGARVCTPQKPHCHTCPVGVLCRAKAELDDPTCLPLKAPKKKKPRARGFEPLGPSPARSRRSKEPDELTIATTIDSQSPERPPRPKAVIGPDGKRDASAMVARIKQDRLRREKKLFRLRAQLAHLDRRPAAPPRVATPPLKLPPDDPTFAKSAHAQVQNMLREVEDQNRASMEELESTLPDTTVEDPSTLNQESMLETVATTPLILDKTLTDGEAAMLVASRTKRGNACDAAEALRDAEQQWLDDAMASAGAGV